MAKVLIPKEAGGILNRRAWSTSPSARAWRGRVLHRRGEHPRIIERMTNLHVGRPNYSFFGYH